MYHPSGFFPELVRRQFWSRLLAALYSFTAEELLLLTYS